MIGQKIKELRINKKISQQELASIVGKTQQAINLWEKGENEPGIEAIKVMADYFGVSTDHLLGFKKYVITDSKQWGYLREAMLEFTGKEEEGSILLETKKIPIYRLMLKNGDEIFAPENIIEWQPVPVDCIMTKGYLVQDNSMSGSHLLVGTRVLIEESAPQDRDIVVAKVPGNILLIRMYTSTNDKITLIPDNSNYDIQTFNANDVNIIGVVNQYITDMKRNSK